MQDKKITLNQRDFKERPLKIQFSVGEFVVGRVGFERRTKPTPLNSRLLEFLADGPLSLRDLTERFGYRNSGRISACLKRLWKKGLILRTRQPVFIRNSVHKGAAGVVVNTRAVNYYALINDPRINSDFVPFSEKKKDGRDLGIKSKAKRILEFLEQNKDKAFYSIEIRNALNLKNSDVMSNMRRYEKKGLVFIRGYQTHDHRSPFQKGYILTWIDQKKHREQALKEAFERTSEILTSEASSNTVYESVRLVRDQLITSKELLSRPYLRDVLHLSKDQTTRAIRRAMKLYSDIKEVRIFGFPYYHHDSVASVELAVQIEMKKNYIRKTKGRDNRLGHNWEACVEWFIDKFTKGAEFVTQKHRTKMDPRRITLHLLKPIGGRKRSAEVDRVWKVTPGLFSPTVTYVLECKWSVVNRRSLDDFINVLKWSTDFGFDTENGREVKKGIIPVFGAGAFNPKEKVVVNGRRITLAQYASGMNIQLLKPSDFNMKLREHGVDKKLTVQKICRVCRDEKDVRVVLDEIWKNPSKAMEVLSEVMTRNQEIFEFEKVLVS